MRLEKIVLDGFKSFADKTDFVFDASVTAIVGPNGCGKSNVVDAVKWVLGEQSVKSLRSGQMADVIFGGSSGRKPLGSAEVSLFISNPDAKLPVDADQVQITRRIYRNGESEYRINNKVSRLRDIRELFMDTGVGTRAYSIIEQGQIEQLVSASKTDRRVIFEEAAGISKYKAHKKETLRKLERTEQNLLRLADILGEVAKRLRSVKLQAGKARNYLQYTQRLKELQVNYSLVEYAKNQDRVREKSDALDEEQQRFAALASEVARNDAMMSKLGNEIIETEQKLSRAGNNLVAVQSRIEQRLQKIEFLRARIAELRERKQSERGRTDTLQQQMTSLKAELAQTRSESAKCGRLLEEKNEAAGQIQETIRRITGECTALEAELEDEKSGIIDIVRRTAQLHNEIQSISVYRDNLANQKDRLTGRAEQARAELERFFTEKAQHNARLGDIEKVIAELTQNLETKRGRIEQVKGAVEADSERLAHSKELRSALNGELAVLADMEKRCEGLTSVVKSLVRSGSADNRNCDYVEGILADIIEADVEYANAVEAALEGRTDTVVINDTDKLLADNETIQKLDGRVSFIGLDRIGPFADDRDFSQAVGVKGRVVEFVRAKSKYAPLMWKLLGKVIVVESIEAAIQLQAETGRGYTFVTLKGQCLGPDGEIKLGPLGKTTGLISRRSRMRQLEETIANITAEITSIEAQIAKSNQTLAHLEKLCKDLRTATYEASTEKTQVNSNLSVVEQNIRRLREEEPLISSEIDLLQEQISQSVQKEYDSKQKLDELEVVNSERMARIEQLEAGHNEKKRQQESLTSELTDLRVALGQIAEQKKALEQTISSLQGRIQANATAADTAGQQIHNCGRELAKAQSDILRCEADVSELFVEKDKSQQSNHTLQEQIEKLLAEQRQTEQLVRAKRAEKDALEQQISQLKIELGQLQVRSQDLVERVRDELQIDLAEAYTNYRDEQVDWEKVKQEITELRGRIERLGNVNLDAIDEQETLEQRHEFLSSQVEDLNHSKAQLQQLISRLNKKSREKFSETFEQIRSHFQEIFRKLFGGGKADIVLEEAEDILEAGIEVIARPPGKETRSISLLSGGEKSMTALSLLFAVFKTKPSPFCFLDEVDAALDEANNERFNLLLSEFQKDSQFIVITHAKRTMSIADVLFGITMQARGVSKKISVRFEEYEEEPAAA